MMMSLGDPVFRLQKMLVPTAQQLGIQVEIDKIWFSFNFRTQTDCF